MHYTCPSPFVSLFVMFALNFSSLLYFFLFFLSLYTCFGKKRIVLNITSNCQNFTETMQLKITMIIIVNSNYLFYVYNCQYNFSSLKSNLARLFFITNEHLTHLFSMHPFSTPKKYKKTLRVFDVFSG